MQNPAKFAVSAVNWIAAVGGVAGLFALLIPDVPRWMSSHGIEGWVTALALLIVAPLLTAATMAVERRQVRELHDREQAAKDLALVYELLDGWTIDSKFFETLVEDLDHNMFPMVLRIHIEDRWMRWSRDSREIRTPQLAQRFAAFKRSVGAYRENIAGYMWTKDDGPGTKPLHEWLSVPREWDESRKDEAYRALNSARSDVVGTLRDLYQTMHELA